MFGKSSDKLHFFPDRLGKFAPKGRVVKTYEQLAIRIGVPLVDDMGRNRSEVTRQCCRGPATWLTLAWN